jgi:oxygen-independent coproporphyrinogen-3 oxidase
MVSAVSPSPDPERSTAAYVHIPFCRRRCYYCDFPVTVVGDRLRGDASGTIRQYVGWLSEEIVATPPSDTPLRSIFFGGGTPSLLDPDQVNHLLRTLEHHCGLAAGAEITMEMDPGTFTRSHLEGYLQAGVNRISLGVQAFQDDLLQACGRTHCVAEIYAAFELLHQCGCTNISLDLISGLPHQSLTQWEDSLNRAIALAPQHLSVYDLVIESGTVFGKRYAPGDAPLPTDERTAQMYRLASDRLQVEGYEHYEISNYAQPSFRCRHNQVYWRNEPYYGFGMGATSYINHQRFSRPRTRVAYREWLEGYQGTGGQIVEPPTSESDRLFETLMLGFRQADGVNLEQLQTTYGSQRIATLLQTLAPFLAKGWVEWVNPDQVRFSDPDGFLFSNQILVELWSGLEPNVIRA